jgi:hypothetical protein
MSQSKLEQAIKRIEMVHNFVEARVMVLVCEGKTEEDALMGAIGDLLAERGEDYRKWLLLSPIISPEKKDALQRTLEREGIDAQSWLDEAYEDRVRWRHVDWDEVLSRLKRAGGA